MTFKEENISNIKSNQNNPRFIKDDDFNTLVKSIKDFPEMLKLRPIVVNKQMIVLGGNMRLKACIEAGLKKVPIIIAENLTEEQEREFIIKDNISGGQWDWDILANEWDNELLEEWGLEVKGFNNDVEEIPEEKTYIPTFRFEVSCNTEQLKTQIMSELMQRGINCTDDY